jgi:polysaccharide deacetylase 2 family uncharacterized protein YibQ
MAVKKKGPARNKRRAASGKRTTAKKVKRTPVLKEFKKIVLGLAALVAICLTAAMIADILIKPGRIQRHPEPVAAPDDRMKPIREEIVSSKEEKVKPTGLKEKSKKQITYEVFDDIEHVIVEKPVKPVEDKIPRVAIIIDDIGYDRKIALALFALNPDITFSILPFSPYGKSIAKRLHAKDAQLMLHLPMEPVEYPKANPGPGAILSSMPPDVLLDQLKKNLQDIPHIQGVNNHMGSRLTESASQMNQIFSILKKHQLFFVDSRTAPRSQCRAAARLLKVPFAQRDVFLDNIQEYKYIKGQLEELAGLARKHGSAIGIGHPYPATLDTLTRELPKLNHGIRIVRAKELTHTPE